MYHGDMSEGQYRCVIFDMDGTLTEPHLDFAAIRAEMGITGDAGILEALEAMPPAQRDEAMTRLLVHELRAAREAGAADGAVEVVRRARQAGLKLALLTRNTREAMRIVLGRFALEFDLTMSREDGPIKPSPVSILQTIESFGVEPAQTACVGDWVFDIQAANAAGCTSILLARDRQLDFADQADYVIHSLWELPDILGI